VIVAVAKLAKDHLPKWSEAKEALGAGWQWLQEAARVGWDSAQRGMAPGNSTPAPARPTCGHDHWAASSSNVKVPTFLFS